MRRVALLVFALHGSVAWAAVLFQEDFEGVGDEGDLKARGWHDIAKWGEDRSLSIATEPEVRPRAGEKCLKIRYRKGGTGGWMHIRFEKVPEVYVRYYRLFPKGWEWPKGHGPHDSIVFAGSYGSPTDTDLSVYLDFWKSADTLVRVATARQKWGYAGYGEVLRRVGGRKNAVAFNVSRPDKVKLGAWHCVEYCAKLSGAGEDDGLLRLWVNGKLVGDLPGVPLVDEKHAAIRFDRWMLGPYFHGGSHREQSNYLDALVISTEYIGTLEQNGNQPPRARFTHRRAWGSMAARFDASRSADPDGRIERFSWDFGDGGRGEGRAPQHTYGRPGSYPVTLTVTDDKGETHAARRMIHVGPCVGSGNGLKAEYFGGQELGREVKSRPIIRTERQIDFRRRGWEGRFLRGEVGDRNGDNYSCRWTGLLQPTHSEDYTLIFEVNDGGRVWFDGQLVIDAWDGPAARSAPVGRLVAGRKYPIRVEHHKGTYKATKDFRAQLLWGSASVEREIIPPTQFYLPDGFVEP